MFNRGTIYLIEAVRVILLNINRGQGVARLGLEYNLREITVAVFFHIHYTKRIELSNDCKRKCYVAKMLFYSARASHTWFKQCWAEYSGFYLFIFCGEIYDTSWSLIGSWHKLTLETIPTLEGASPVNKSADDANSHQQLNHQGQVDFPYETCYKEQKDRCRYEAG